MKPGEERVQKMEGLRTQYQRCGSASYAALIVGEYGTDVSNTKCDTGKVDRFQRKDAYLSLTGPHDFFLSQISTLHTSIVVRNDHDIAGPASSIMHRLPIGENIELIPKERK